MIQLRGASMITYVRDHHGAAAARGFRVLMTGGTMGRYALFRILGRPEQARENAAYLRGMWVGAPDMTD